VHTHARPSEHALTRTCICARIERMDCGRIAQVVCARARSHCMKKRIVLACRRAPVRERVRDCVHACTRTRTCALSRTLAHLHAHSNLISRASKCKNARQWLQLLPKKMLRRTLGVNSHIHKSFGLCFRWSSVISPMHVTDLYAAGRSHDTILVFSYFNFNSTMPCTPACAYVHLSSLRALLHSTNIIDRGEAAKRMTLLFAARTADQRNFPSGERGGEVQ
jgi:hypothetical protein